MVNYLKVIYYTFLLWLESFGSDAKSDITIIPTPQAIEHHRRNEKLRAGVTHLVKWLKKLTPDERAALIKDESNILMMAGRKQAKTTLEKLSEARAAAKLVAGPRKEGEQAMAETFVKNQEKYKLLAKRKILYRELRDGTRPAMDINKELKVIRDELRKYE